MYIDHVDEVLTSLSDSIGTARSKIWQYNYCDNMNI